MSQLYFLLPVVALIVIFILPATSAKRLNCYIAGEQDHDLMF